MRFSERIGKKQVRQELQIDGMDAPLLNRLWNMISTLLSRKIKDIGMYDFRRMSDKSRSIAIFLWHQFFGRPIDSVPVKADEVHEEIRDWFYKAKWYEVYELLEFLVSIIEENSEAEEFKRVCNVVLEEDGAGYRFVGKEIAPIVSEVEIQAVEQAANECSAHRFEGAKQHLDAALEKLADRQNPDYRNSIKESISAVESVCAIVSGEPKVTLGQALKKIKDSVGLHPALEKGMSSIYGYTSNADGIRHAMIEESDCDLADAKYMLVSCSAFINYLIMKAEKAGLLK